MEKLNSLLEKIKARNPDINQNILEAFKVCDRKFFVKEFPYVDEPIHIAHGQTISQPSTIARMIKLLCLKKGMNVLEVGTNTGYHAALVAYLVFPGKVTTTEIFPDLAEMARQNIKKLIEHLKKKSKIKAKRLSRIKVVVGDALDKNNEIWKEKYNRIYFTASVNREQEKEVKAMAKKLLKGKGLLLYPTNELFMYGSLKLWKKNKELKLVLEEEGYAFVPLLRKEDLMYYY